jgi:hypothetical protein
MASNAGKTCRNIDLDVGHSSRRMANHVLNTKYQDFALQSIDFPLSRIEWKWRHTKTTDQPFMGF